MTGARTTVANLIVGITGAAKMLYLGSLAYRKACSARLPRTLAVHKPNSIVGGRHVRIGGLEPYIQIYCEDRDNRVLLNLHELLTRLNPVTTGEAHEMCRLERK